MGSTWTLRKSGLGRCLRNTNKAEVGRGGRGRGHQGGAVCGGRGKGREETGKIPRFLASVTRRMMTPFTEMEKNGEKQVWGEIQNFDLAMSNQRCLSDIFGEGSREL